RALLEQAIAIDRRLVVENPTEIDVPSIRSDLARAYNHLGMLHKAARRHDQAETCYQEAIANLETLVRQKPDETLYRTNLASTHHNLGNLRREAGRPGALASFERARDLCEELVRERPAVSSFRARLATAIGSIATFQRFSNQLDA